MRLLSCLLSRECQIWDWFSTLDCSPHCRCHVTAITWFTVCYLWTFRGLELSEADPSLTEPTAAARLSAEAFHEVRDCSDLFIISHSGTQVDGKWINRYEKTWCIYFKHLIEGCVKGSLNIGVLLSNRGAGNPTSLSLAQQQSAITLTLPPPPRTQVSHNLAF